VTQLWSTKDFGHHSPRYLDEADAQFREMRATNLIDLARRAASSCLETVVLISEEDRGHK
jgi:hypothetical protein